MLRTLILASVILSLCEHVTPASITLDFDRFGTHVDKTSGGAFWNYPDETVLRPIPVPSALSSGQTFSVFDLEEDLPLLEIVICSSGTAANGTSAGVTDVNTTTRDNPLLSRAPIFGFPTPSKGQVRSARKIDGLSKARERERWEREREREREREYNQRCISTNSFTDMTVHWRSRRIDVLRQSGRRPPPR